MREKKIKINNKIMKTTKDKTKHNKNYLLQNKN